MFLNYYQDVFPLPSILEPYESWKNNSVGIWTFWSMGGEKGWIGVWGVAY